MNTGQEYYYIDSWGGVRMGMWLGVPSDADKASIGNVFKTEEEAKKVVEKLKAMQREKDG